MIAIIAVLVCFLLAFIFARSCGDKIISDEETSITNQENLISRQYCVIHEEMIK